LSRPCRILPRLVPEPSFWLICRGGRPLPAEARMRHFLTWSLPPGPHPLPPMSECVAGALMTLARSSALVVALDHNPRPNRLRTRASENSRLSRGLSPPLWSLNAFSPVINRRGSPEPKARIIKRCETRMMRGMLYEAAHTIAPAASPGEVVPWASRRGPWRSPGSAGNQESGQKTKNRFGAWPPGPPLAGNPGHRLGLTAPKFPNGPGKTASIMRATPRIKQE